MFLLCVLYSNENRYSQDNQDKEVVQVKYREQNGIPPGAWLFVLYVKTTRQNSG